MSDCWFMPNVVADQRAENRLTPNRPSDFETLAALGVFYRRFDPDTISDDVGGFIQPLMDQLGYHSHDVINISKESFGEEKFEDMARQHFQEHLHEDDEVRLILDGSGYFDVRSAEDEWIRVVSKPGDCLVLPAGIYHRFTTDENLYIKTVRLFKENPKWLAVPRENGEGDRTEARKLYLQRIHAAPLTIAGPAESNKADVFSLRYPNVFDSSMARLLTHFAKRIEAVKGAAGLADKSEADLGVLLMYITGSASPYTHGESWCPDCVAAKPHVLEGLGALREKFAKLTDGEQNAAAAAPVFFVEAPVERAAYAGNPAYPYRTHPFLALKGVPTVLVLTLKEGSLASILGDEGKLLKEKNHPWYELVDVRVRTEEPTAQLLSEF